MGTIQLELARDDEDAITRLTGLGADPILAEPDHFEGGPEIVTAVVQVSAVALPVLAMLIRERIRARRYIKVKLKGLEITGAELKDVESFLRAVERE
jgi:hypothetical protein